MGNKKMTINFSFVQSCIVSVVISCIMMISMVCIGAIFIQNEYVTLDAATIISLIINFAAAFCGMIIAGKLQKGREAVTAGVTAIAYCTLLICSGMLFFDGISASVFGELIAVAVAYIVAYFLLNSTKNRQSRKRKNRRYR